MRLSNLGIGIDKRKFTKYRGELMSLAKWKSRQLIGVKLVVLALLLGTSGLTITACQQSDTESETTEQEAEQPTEEEPQTEAEKKYEEEGKDTTDDDDPE